MTTKYTKDIQLENYSILFYSHPRLKDSKGYPLIEVECGICKQHRGVQNAAINHKDFTGLCICCFNKYTAPSHLGSNHPYWKGGRTLTKEGYVYLHYSLLSSEDQNLIKPMLIKSGYVLEHRYVMAKQINRSLLKREIVHHMNGIKNDNRSENLMLVSSITHREVETKIIDSLKARIRELESQLSS